MSDLVRDAALCKEGEARERHVAVLEQQIGDLSGRVQSAQAAALQADQQREQAANRAAVSSAAQSAAEVAHAEVQALVVPLRSPESSWRCVLNQQT